MEIINTFKQSIAKIFDGTTVFVSFLLLIILCGPAISWSLHNGSRIFLGTSQKYGLVKYDRLLRYTFHLVGKLLTFFVTSKRSNFFISSFLLGLVVFGASSTPHHEQGLTSQL
jgi:hypothetical protein